VDIISILLFLSLFWRFSRWAFLSLDLMLAFLLLGDHLEIGVLHNLPAGGGSYFLFVCYLLGLCYSPIHFSTLTETFSIYRLFSILLLLWALPSFSSTLRRYFALPSHHSVQQRILHQSVVRIFDSWVFIIILFMGLVW